MDRLFAEAYWRFGIQRENENTIWSPWMKNTICQGFGDLVGALIGLSTPGSTVPSGINGPLYIAVGEGVTNGSWDYPNVAPPVNKTDTHLVQEISRKAANVSGYRNAAPPAGAVQTYPTANHFDRPVYTASWTTSQALSTLGMREVGLFGGVGASTGGLLLNVLRHPFQLKTSTDPYTLTWEVEFKIVWE